MRHACIGQKLHCRRGASNQGDVPDQRPRLAQHTPKKLGHEANRGEYIALYLIGVVEHVSSAERAPSSRTSIPKKRFPIRSTTRRSYSTSKAAQLQGYIRIDKSLRKGVE